MIVFKLVQPLNAMGPMDTRVSGNSIDDKRVQPKNAERPTERSAEGNATDFNSIHR